MLVSSNRFPAGTQIGSSCDAASRKTHDQNWVDAADSSTHTAGGDPAISSFNNASEWTQWAQSVETTSPVLTSVALEPLWSLIPVTDPRHNNLIQAVRVYASNASFPLADLVNYQMSWCACENITMSQDPSTGSFGYFCPTGKFHTTLQGLMQVKNVPPQGWQGWVIEPDYAPEKEVVQCCLPCFTVRG
jgi:hypothetical protein